MCFSTAFPSSFAPLVSNGVAGTQDGSESITSRGTLSEAFEIYSQPAVPKTLVISWGSATTAVVPLGTIRRANSSGERQELSICTCASISPGITVKDEQSISFTPSYSPTPTIFPSVTAISPLLTPPEKTSTKDAFFKTSSAFSSRRAARIYFSNIFHLFFSIIL